MSQTGLITPDRQSVTRHAQATQGAAAAADSALPLSFSLMLLNSQQAPLPAAGTFGQLQAQATQQGVELTGLEQLPPMEPVPAMDANLGPQWQWQSSGLSGGNNLPLAGEQLPPPGLSEPLTKQADDGNEALLPDQLAAGLVLTPDLAAQDRDLPSAGADSSSAGVDSAVSAAAENLAADSPIAAAEDLPAAMTPEIPSAEFSGAVELTAGASAERAAAAALAEMIPEAGRTTAGAATTMAASAAADAAARFEPATATTPAAANPDPVLPHQAVTATAATAPDMAARAPVSLLNETSQMIDIAERIRNWRGPSAAAEPPIAAESVAPAPRQAIVAPGQLQVFAEQLQAAAPAPDPAAASTTMPAGTLAEESLPAAPPRQDNAPAQQVRNAPAAAFNPHTFSQLGHAIDQPQWGESFARHIALLTGQNVSSAQVQLDPPELGSLMVRINIVGDQASISFVSPHPHVRDSIEQNFDRLQDMLSEQGLDLVDVDVSDQSFGGRGDQTPEAEAEHIADVQRDAEPQTLARQVGLVDYYI